MTILTVDTAVTAQLARPADLVPAGLREEGKDE